MILKNYLKAVLLLSAMALSANATAQVTFRCIGGTDVNGGEGCAKALDSDLNTKWGMYGPGDKFMVIEASQPVYITGICFTNASDNANWRRNIKEWELLYTDDEGIAKANQEKVEGWKLFGNMRGDKVMYEYANFANYYYAMNPLAEPHKYFMFKRVAGRDGQSQLAELSFSYTTDNNAKVTVYDNTGGFGDNESPGKVFDGDARSKWCCGYGAGQEKYVVFGYGMPVAINGYSMQTAYEWGVDDRRPKTWVLYGSTAAQAPGNGDASWEVIDEVSNENFFVNDSQDGKGEGSFSCVGGYRSLGKTTKPYTFFKFVVKENMGANVLQIGELTLYRMDNGTLNNMQINDNTTAVFNGNCTVRGLKYTREQANEWGTVCMPFALASNDKVEYYTLSSVNADYMLFAKAEKLDPYQPAAFRRMAGDIIDLSGESTVNTTPAEAKAQPIADWTMVGATKAAAIDATKEPNAVYCISNNKYVKVTETLNLKAFRAYFTTPNASGAKAMFAISTGEVTGIGDVTFKDVVLLGNNEITVVPASDKVVSVFATDGKLVARKNGKAGQAVSFAVAKGLYIVNKVKVIVK